MDDLGVHDVDAGPETLTTVLPNELLLQIFSYLDEHVLLRVEHVCRRWKSVVETCFAAKKKFYIRLTTLQYFNVFERLERYGPSLQIFKLYGRHTSDSQINWTKEIADRFPNLLTVELSDITITEDDFKYLSTKCCQLKTITLENCSFTDEGLMRFLQALPGIKSLSIHTSKGRSITSSQSYASAVFSTCRNLETFEMQYFDGSDTDNFSRFCKECVTLRKLVIRYSEMPNEMFVQIQHCSLLEELELNDCPKLCTSAMISISKGCPNLRSLYSSGLPLVSEEGLMCFARCRNLSLFDTNETVTDETLFQLSKCGNLRKFEILHCPLVTDRGCAALLVHCPQLELLAVLSCKGVSNSTVDAAIQAVQGRQNGLVLRLMVKGTRVTRQTYKNCHPLLRLYNEIY